MIEHERPQPALNVPTVILVSIAALVIIHFYSFHIASPAGFNHLLVDYAFFPIRFDVEARAEFGEFFSGGLAGASLSLVSYGFLHADWLHLTVNAFWMLVFGSALARRFGTLRFLLISLIGSAAGALLHLAAHWGSPVPVVGASAAVSAHMACAARFAFVPYGPLGRPRSNHPGAYFLPALSIMGMGRNVQVVSFLGIWFLINLLFGLGSGVVAGDTAIAWQAHIGGLLAGLILFPLLDPVAEQE